jgi:hypothetical protein
MQYWLSFKKTLPASHGQMSKRITRTATLCAALPPTLEALSTCWIM